jgi:hypothetical protein
MWENLLPRRRALTHGLESDLEHPSASLRVCQPTGPSSMAISGSKYDADDHRTMRKLIQSFENMDNLVIEMAQGYRDLTVTPPGLASRVLGIFGQTQPAGNILEDGLHILEAAREAYLNSNYDMESMLAYIARTSELAPTWQLMTASMLRLKNTQVANSPETTYWSLIYRRLERAGTVAWESVVPASSILSKAGEEVGEGRGGAHMLNAIIDKFAALDDVLDVLHLEFGHGDQRQRFSDELRDTLYVLVKFIKPLSDHIVIVKSFALIQYFSSSGGYAPLPSAEQIQALKAEIRHRRNMRQASNEAEMASPDPPIQTSAIATVSGSTDSSWREVHSHLCQHMWRSTHFVFWSVDLSSWDNNSMCKHHHVALCDPGIHSMAICHTQTRDSSRCWLLVSYPRIDDATPGVVDYDNPIGWKSSIAHPAVVLDVGFHRNELWLCNSCSSDLPLPYHRIQLNADVYCLCHARVCHPADCPHC